MANIYYYKENQGTAVAVFNPSLTLHRKDGPSVINESITEAGEKINLTEEWYWEGELHRDDGPALYNSYEGIRAWYQHGKRHREDGPAEIVYHVDIDDESFPKNDSENILYISFYHHGEARVGAPFRITFDDKKNIIEEEWYHPENYGSEELPVKVSYYASKNIKTKFWLTKEGLQHRKSGPAVINYEENGAISIETWFLHGEYHREDGPAIICYYDGRKDFYGKIGKTIWYLEGKKIL